MLFATAWMDLEITTVLSEVTQKDKYHAISLICGNIKYDIKSMKQTQGHRETELWLPGLREGGEGMAWDSGISRCKLSYIQWINETPLYGTGDSVQYSVGNFNEKEHEGERICTNN